jgi:hypothetical protein
MTEDQRELISHLLDLLDRGMESDTIANLFQQEPDEAWERRMNEAAQELAEEFQGLRGTRNWE